MNDPLLTLTLGEAWRRLVYTASCSDCEHWTRVDLKRLAEDPKYGPEFPLRDVRQRLRCSRCRSRRIIIATIDKDSTAASNHLHRWPFDYD